MSDLLAIPLKKPSDVDIAKPLKNVISSSYSQSDKSQVYIEAINELSKLRSTAIWKVFEKYESSLDLIYSYYDQLSSLESKVPSNEIQIPFKWKDAFDKGSIFGGRISLTVSSLAYEKVCILFNIASLQSCIASTQNLDSDEGLKLSAKFFQQAAGIFNYLKGNVMAAIQQEPTPDLNPDTLGALTSLMIAQAQEIFVLKAIHDRMKDGIIAKLCSQCEELYADALKLFQKEFLRNLWEKEWIPTVAGKQAAYHGLTEYFQSLVCKNNKNIGEEISRLERAIELLKASQNRSNRPTNFQDWLNKAERNLTEAKKDNDFIYHERIPDWKNLTPVGRALLAKQLPIPERFSTNFKDLFESLVPVAIHQAMASYDVRKNEIVNTEIARLRESTQLLNSLLASLNLPAALEETSGSALPQSLVEKSEAIQAAGGLSALEATAKELPELLQRNKDILDESDRILNDEQSSDQQLRQQFGEKWNRTPSEELTKTFRSNAAKYREIINNAMQADNVVREKFATHRRGMELLSQGKDAMESAVPACGNAGNSSLRQGMAFKQLTKLMEEVETIKAERDVIESELKSATTDIHSTFLNALNQDGGVNEPALSLEMLHRVYSPLQKQVADSLTKQEKIISQIQEQNSEFCKEKSGAGSENEREAELKLLASAHDAFTELQNNLREGAKFYNDLTQLLVTFQNKISDFCFARKTEKEELMKDLTQQPTRQNFEIPSPTSPTTQDSKKQAPPRPPPPQNQQIPAAAAQSAPTAPGIPGGLPYPMYPSGMPMPYGAPPAAPYPTYVTPMPGGFNPYSGPQGAPYPHQPGYQYPFPQVPYSTYPGTYPGAHGHQRPW